MSADLDRYDAWYSEKLWTLLPELYRARDSDDVERDGPLRELVDRIGAQAAIVRRSIDRLWEDQSIETCDDWVIDYLGEVPWDEYAMAKSWYVRLKSRRSFQPLLADRMPGLPPPNAYTDLDF